MEQTFSIFEDTAIAFADKSQSDLKKEHFFFNVVRNRKLVKVGSAIAEFALKLGLPITPLFKHTVFNYFVGGETLEESRPVINTLSQKNIGCMINYGVEGEDSEADFDESLRVNLQALKFAANEPFVKSVCIKLTGIGSFQTFEKMQGNKVLSDEEQVNYQKAVERLDKLCQQAYDCDTSLYIDAEEYWIQEVLDKMVLEAMKKFNREKAVVFDTIQLYRWDQLDYLKKLIRMANTEGFILGVKLVRGAYMEKERKRAQKNGYKSPIHSSKKNTDSDFDQSMEICLQNINHVAICIATHNEDSCFKLTQLMAKLNIDKNHSHVQLAQLYGMGDHITFNLADQGFNANKYLPFGPVKNVIPYLIRRASENSSVEGQIGRELSLIKKEIARRTSLS